MCKDDGRVQARVFLPLLLRFNMVRTYIHRIYRTYIHHSRRAIFTTPIHRSITLVHSVNHRISTPAIIPTTTMTYQPLSTISACGSYHHRYTPSLIFTAGGAWAVDLAHLETLFTVSLNQKHKHPVQDHAKLTSAY